jgi:hypothetical protein
MPPPVRLPPEMSGRFRVGTDLAGRLHALGYTRELGFHQFLYPSEPDTRALLKFLLDKMPKAPDADTAAQDDGVRGRAADTAAERAAAAVAAALRRGSGFAATKKSGGGGGGLAALKGALKAGGGGLAAVAAIAAKDARRNAVREARPFWTTPLTTASSANVPFTSGAPRGYLAPSLLEYTAGSVVAAQMKAEAQLARLAAADGTSTTGRARGPGGKAFLVDADGNPIADEDLARLIAAGYKGGSGLTTKKTTGGSAVGADGGETTIGAGVAGGAGAGGGGGIDGGATAAISSSDAAAAAVEAAAAAAAAAASGADAADTVERRLERREAELEQLQERMRESAVGLYNFNYVDPWLESDWF